MLFRSCENDSPFNIPKNLAIEVATVVKDTHAKVDDAMKVVVHRFAYIQQMRIRYEAYCYLHAMGRTSKVLEIIHRDDEYSLVLRKHDSSRYAHVRLVRRYVPRGYDLSEIDSIPLLMTVMREIKKFPMTNAQPTAKY